MPPHFLIWAIISSIISSRSRRCQRQVPIRTSASHTHKGVAFPRLLLFHGFSQPGGGIQSQPGGRNKGAAGRRPHYVGGRCSRRAGADGLPCSHGSSRKTLELHMNRLYCIAATLAIGMTASGAFAQGTPAGAAAAPAGAAAATGSDSGATTTAPAATTTTAPADKPAATTTDKSSDDKSKKKTARRRAARASSIAPSTAERCRHVTRARSRRNITDTIPWGR